jgi:hypothetical protein
MEEAIKLEWVLPSLVADFGHVVVYTRVLALIEEKN